MVRDGAPRALRYVALGDSYTIGTSVSATDRWPDRLALAVTVPPGLEVVANLAVNGYTSADLIREELPPLAGLAPGFVSVLIGVNDVVQEVPAAAYAANVGLILDRVLSVVPADRILTVGIPDYTVTPAGRDYGDPVQRRAAIEANDAIMARLSDDRGIAFVPVEDLSRRAADDRSLVAADGLHPSGMQYALWVERIAPVVQGLLADS